MCTTGQYCPPPLPTQLIAELVKAEFDRFLFFFFQELFVQYLATYSYKHGRGKEKRSLTYSDLSHTAEESETFQFLADILPKKILASKYLKMLEREKRDGKVEDDEEDEDDDDKEEESEEEDDES
nr:chromatin accessibility complex protein 1 [Pelodiscus sinensis]|eukprot:XP_025040660.1 chromatin accessibility complex protein 1 [Pelodiscus sinensis]